METFHGTTILTVRRAGKVVVGGDGQVTLGNTVMKGNATKVRKIYGEKVIVGFAGATADAFTLLDRFEAMLIVADAEHSLLVSGTGDVIETHDDLMAIGSGGPFAQSAARALFDNTELSARGIVEKSLEIAGDICIYTNHSRTIEEI